ncbi:hypothetical protein O0L34_g6224 [Tuta absoluta]|nr:hypothetical protein O0L34_g6224 [Tuta absoluta]
MISHRITSLLLAAKTIMAFQKPASIAWQVKYSSVTFRNSHLLRSHEWSDCAFEFQTGDADAGDLKESLCAHRLILAAASPVFAAMFYGNVGQKASPVIVTDIDKDTFGAMLNYIYTDAVDITDVDAACSLYKAANKYILPHLETRCLEYIANNLNPNNVCSIYEFACLYSYNALIEKCLEMFSSKTQYVLKGASFLSAHVNTLKTIFSMDTLDINSEMDLFVSLLKYVHSKALAGQLDKDYTKHNDEGNDERTNNEENNNKNEDKSFTCVSETKALEPSSKKLRLDAGQKQRFCEEARKNMCGLIEEIRFLSMKPADLAKIGESSSILTEKEKLAILVNSFCPNSKMPMPEGFSLIRQPRIRGAATVTHTVRNVSRMIRGVGDYSQTFSVRNIPWILLAKREWSLEKGNPPKETLGVYFGLNIDSKATQPPPWSCEVQWSVTLVSANNTHNITHKANTKFTSSEKKHWGFRLLEWNQLLQPGNCYIKDDCVTVQFHLTTKPLVFN